MGIDNEVEERDTGVVGNAMLHHQGSNLLFCHVIVDFLFDSIGPLNHLVNEKVSNVFT